MKKTKFTETQIVKAIKEAESGCSVADISRELGINPRHLTIGKRAIQAWMAGISSDSRNLKKKIAG